MSATPLETALRRVTERLESARATFCLVGGLAVSVRCEPRFTRDIDLAIAASDDARAETLVRALGADGWFVTAVIEQEAVGRLATVRLQPPSDLQTSAVVDLLFASSGVEAEVAAAAEPLEVLPGLVVPVARVGDLIVLKLLARAEDRPQDDVDLVALANVAGPADHETATARARLVMERGYSRDRDLMSDVERLFG